MYSIATRPITPKAFCCATLLFVIAGLFVVASINWLVNPFGQYRSRILPATVQDSRNIKLGILKTYSVPPNGLILGSSRVHKFEPEYLERKCGCVFFNAGVNHGRPVDYLAWIRWYQDQWDRLPEMVIIGIDTESLTDTIPIDGRVTASSALARFVRNELPWRARLAPATELFSFKQSKASLASIGQLAKRTHVAEPIEYFDLGGKIVYRKREAELAEGRYDFESAFAFNDAEFRSIYRDYSALSLTELKALCETVELLKSQQCEVILFKTTSHPRFRAILRNLENYAARDSEVMQLIELIGKRFGAPVFDFSDIESYAGDPDAFVDAIHPLEINTRRMIDRLVNKLEAPQVALQ